MMSPFAKPARGLAALLFLLAAMTAPPSSAAEWREEIGTFRVGMVVIPGAGRRDFDVLEEAFSKVLTMPVQFVPHGKYRTLIEAQLSGRVDYAVYSTTAFALAFLLCECVEPLAAPVSRDGSTGFRSVLIVDPEKITDPSELKGKRIGHISRDSLSGWIIPQSLFKAGGVTLEESGATFLLHKDFETLIAAFRNGEIDGFFGWSRDPASGEAERDPMESESQLRRRGVGEEGYDIAWRSEPFRFGPHTVRKNLDKEARDLIVKFLADLKEKQPEVFEILEPTHDGGLQAVTQADYQPVLGIIRSLNDEKASK